MNVELDLQNRKVMVVEDEFYLAADLKACLGRWGATVVGPFPVVEDATAALEHAHPDCAVLDINLAGESCFGLARQLRRDGVPFLFYTGYDQSVIPQEFEDVIRLEKPVDVARLAQALGPLCCRIPTQVNPG